ncbi:hypothetical protein SAMN06265222_118104 [Neorhodopirellula lusitana]|uniref:Uncharacterized protein n=1 Tax=Neorhodopirellula lusitana TaxID=445327 RepID=A0ABY1QMJ2_9BACT|nr:hypothetical protein SAMN06265222_118104 [Neorhodopirellula lusitana]
MHQSEVLNALISNDPSVRRSLRTLPQEILVSSICRIIDYYGAYPVDTSSNDVVVGPAVVRERYDSYALYNCDFMRFADSDEQRSTQRFQTLVDAVTAFVLSEFSGGCTRTHDLPREFMN